MAKKGNRLREFEKNNRVLDISSAQKVRQEKRKNKQEKKEASKEGQASGIGFYESSEKNTKKKANWIKPVCIVISLVFVVFVAMSVKNIFELKDEEAALREKKAELTRMKEELTLRLDNVNSDEFIEEEARKTLKLVKGNELIFFFPEDMELNRNEEEKDGEETADEE